MIDEEHTNDWLSGDEAAGMIRAYERASRFNPRDAQMYFDYGIAFIKFGTGFEKYAIEAFKAAARLCPSRSAFHSYLGLAYASANRREEAIESYKQAHTLRPEDIDTLAALAHAYLLLGRYDETERTATRMIQTAPLASGSHLILGVAQLLQCRYKDADESFRHAVSLEPGLAETRYGIGLVAIAFGNDSMRQFQNERLGELYPRLRWNLLEHLQGRSFTTAELINYLV